MVARDFEQALDAVHMLGSQSKIPPKGIAREFAEDGDHTGSAVPHVIDTIPLSHDASSQCLNSPQPAKTSHRGGDHDDRKNAHHQYNRGLHTH